MKKTITILGLLVLMSIFVTASIEDPASYDIEGGTAEPGLVPLAFISGQTGNPVVGGSHIVGACDATRLPTTVGSGCAVGQYIVVYQCDLDRNCQRVFTDDWKKDTSVDNIPYYLWFSQTWLQNLVKDKPCTMYYCLEGDEPTEEPGEEPLLYSNVGQDFRVTYVYFTKPGSTTKIHSTDLKEEEVYDAHIIIRNLGNGGTMAMEAAIMDRRIDYVAASPTATAFAVISGGTAIGVCVQREEWQNAARVYIGRNSEKEVVYRLTAPTVTGSTQDRYALVISSYLRCFNNKRPQDPTYGKTWKVLLHVDDKFWGPSPDPTAHCDNSIIDEGETDLNCGDVDRDCDRCPQNRRCSDANNCEPGLICADDGRGYKVCIKSKEEVFVGDPYCSPDKSKILQKWQTYTGQIIEKTVKTCEYQCQNNKCIYEAQYIGNPYCSADKTKVLQKYQDSAGQETEKTIDTCPAGSGCKDAVCEKDVEVVPCGKESTRFCEGKTVKELTYDANCIEQERTIEICGANEECIEGECTEEQVCGKTGVKYCQSNKVMEIYYDEDCLEKERELEDCGESKACEGDKCVDKPEEICTENEFCPDGFTVKKYCVGGTSWSEEYDCEEIIKSVCCGDAPPTQIPDWELETACENIVDNSLCQGTPPDPKQTCTKDVVCDDGTIIYSCTNGVLEATGLSCGIPGECTTNTECNDNNPLTTDKCVDGICKNSIIPSPPPNGGEDNTTLWIVGGSVLAVLAGIIIYQRTSKKKGKRKKKR